MTPKLEKAEYLENYKIFIAFVDGSSGAVDLKEELWGEVFEPLKDISEFRKFILNHELNTITWPNGADFAPEFLYEKVTA